MPRDVPRVIALAAEAVQTWIASELRGDELHLRLAQTVREVVTALLEEPPPRAQILVVDMDALSAADVLHLHALRSGGWFGSIIALGQVTDDLRSSLTVERVLARPLTGGTLRRAVLAVGLHRPTTEMRRIR